MPSTRKSGGEAPLANNGKKPRKEKRQLVRWDQELDTLLLLTVQSACNLTGVKVPWEKVAELMGPKFTEGAIVQHLSKLRIRREAAGQRVPPPLRRSVTAAAAAAGGGGKGGHKSGRKNTRKRKRSGEDDDFSDDLDAQEEDESDPEYLQDKKKYKTRRSSFPNRKKSSLLGDDDELMCAGAPFLRHLGQEELEAYQSETEEESDDDGAHELDEDYDSEYLAKIKAEQGSPTPRPSRVVKLPVSLRNRDPNALKSIRSLDDATPPPSSLSGSRNQSFENNDQAMMNNNTGPMFGQQVAWFPGPIQGSQNTENPFHAGHSQIYWPAPAPVVGDRILRSGEFIWSPHAPAFASGHGGSLAVSGPPPQPWGPDSATAGAPSAQAMNSGMWYINSNAFEQQDENNEAQGSHDQEQDDEEY